MRNKSADGLRGIAALNVTVHHFLAAFLPTALYKNYPFIFSENTSPSNLFNILTSPFFSIFYNGQFAVLIFFALSGYVLTLPYYSKNDNSKTILQKRLLGRYFRLGIPIAVCVTISYFLYRSGMYYNVQAAEFSGSNWIKSFYLPGISALTAVKEATYDAMFFGKATLVPPLWTLKVEFIGSIYILLFYIFSKKDISWLFFLIIFALIYTIHRQESIYYFCIFFGSLLNKFKKFSNYRFFIFLIGFYFGSFQFYSSWHDFLPKLDLYIIKINDIKTFYNAIGAIMITLSVVQGFGSKIFESHFFQFLAKISFPMYLIHFMVLFSISSFICAKTENNNLLTIINFAIYLIFCIIFSSIFEKLIDKKSVKISRKLAATMQSRLKRWKFSSNFLCWRKGY
jgi:peptidoglycan/LPS O-acetylase OafA/YrhL